MASSGFTTGHRTRSMPLIGLTPMTSAAEVGTDIHGAANGPHSDHLVERDLPREEYLGEMGSSLDEEKVYLAAWKGPLTGAISDFTSTLAAGVRRRGTEERSGGDGWRSNSASHVDLRRLAQEATSGGEDDEEEDSLENSMARAKNLGLDFGRVGQVNGGPTSSFYPEVDHQRLAALDSRLALAKSHRPVIFHDLSETEESRDPDSWYTPLRTSTDVSARDDYFGGHSPALVRSQSRSEQPYGPQSAGAQSASSLPLYANQRSNYDDITCRTQPTTPGAVFGLGPPHLFSTSHHGSPEVHHHRRLPQESAEAEEHEREIERLRQALELSVARGKMSMDDFPSTHQPAGSHPMSHSNSRGHSRRESALYPSRSNVNLMGMSSINGQEGGAQARDSPQRTQPSHSERNTPPKTRPAKEEGLGVWWIDVLHRLFELPLTLAGVEDVGMGKREGLEETAG